MPRKLDRYIEISSVGFTLYGWDVMTSVLIHDFGHYDLFNQGISEGSTRDEAVKIEIRQPAWVGTDAFTFGA